MAMKRMMAPMAKKPMRAMMAVRILRILSMKPKDNIPMTMASFSVTS